MMALVKKRPALRAAALWAVFVVGTLLCCLSGVLVLVAPDAMAALSPFNWYF
jgi:hypothetical protein